MKQCLFITSHDSRYGFNLAGFQQLVIDHEQLESSLQRSMADQVVGIIAIDERLLAGIEEERLQAMEKRWHGIVVVLPPPEMQVEKGEDFALRLIRRAVGYQVRLTP